MLRLRNPDGGCPWDLAQTPLTLTPYVIEESLRSSRCDSNRVINKILLKNLAILLLQVVLQSQVFQDQGDFDLSDVAKGIADKMVRRHPHVFETTEGNPNPTTPAAVKQTWEEIKTAEKAHIEDSNPPLAQAEALCSIDAAAFGCAEKYLKKAAKAGFEWNNIEEVWEKVAEEMAEFRHALDHESKADQEGELGDLFFSLIQIARWKGLDPVAALQGTNRRFVAAL